MTQKIGFVLLSHNKPEQLLRLTRRLVHLYGDAPIVCHHDFSQCSLNGLVFPSQVIFVRPHLETKWAGMSLILAFLRALKIMYQRLSPPDWFVLLSGSDYPVRPPQTVLDELASGGFDAYLDHRLVEYPWTPDPKIEYAPHAFKCAGWIPLAHDRYVAIHPCLPWYSLGRRRFVKLTVGHIRSKRLLRFFTPFTETLKCYGGSQWFTGNHRAAERLLATNSQNRILFEHFSGRFIPDESLPHTILCNQADLRISENDLRYIDWRMGGYHPKTLGLDDIPRILASGAHFARKFDLAMGPEVFDAIDEIVDSSGR